MSLIQKFACLFLSKNKKYQYAMFKAIDLARQTVWDFDKKESKTNGLRVIKRFQKVNKIKFNPFDERHIELIYGNASHESFFRKTNKILRK